MNQVGLYEVRTVAFRCSQCGIRSGTKEVHVVNQIMPHVDLPLGWEVKYTEQNGWTQKYPTRSLLCPSCVENTDQ